MMEEKEIWKRLTADNGDELRFSNLGRYQKEIDGEWVDVQPSYDKANGYHILKHRVLMYQSNPTLHQVIATLFVPNPKRWWGRMVVDHKNEDKLDNRASNLEWVTQGENVARYRSKHLYDRSKYICIETNEIFDSKDAIARWLNKRPATVSSYFTRGERVINGYHFEEVTE